MEDCHILKVSLVYMGVQGQAERYSKILSQKIQKFKKKKKEIYTSVQL